MGVIVFMCVLPGPCTCMCMSVLCLGADGIMISLHTVCILLQNEVVALDPFCPKEVTAQDREAGLCTMSQFPTQAMRMISGDGSSQFPSQQQDLRNIPTQCTVSRNDNFKGEPRQSSVCNKKARLLEDDDQKGLPSSGVHLNDSIYNMNSTRDKISRDNVEVSHAVPDVAAAIEDLLEQTSKVQHSDDSFTSLLIIKFIG